MEVLYELQLIDSQLDELEELRGDLPLTVNELKGQMQLIQDQINSKEEEKKINSEKRISNEEEIERLSANLKKFKTQLYQVRNNKEYDALTKEIDHTESEIDKLTKEIDDLEILTEQLKNEIDELVPQLDKLNNELKEKESGLKEIIAANEKEEKKWNELRNEVVEKVRKPDLNTYTRIRKAKNGIAIASVVRSTCTGCHSMVPPQRQLEIKTNKRIYTCEACGRILISNEITERVSKKLGF